MKIGALYAFGVVSKIVYNLHFTDKNKNKSFYGAELNERNYRKEKKNNFFFVSAQYEFIYATKNSSRLQYGIFIRFMVHS